MGFFFWVQRVGQMGGTTLGARIANPRDRARRVMDISARSGGMQIRDRERRVE